MAILAETEMPSMESNRAQGPMESALTNPGGDNRAEASANLEDAMSAEGVDLEAVERRNNSGDEEDDVDDDDDDITIIMLDQNTLNENRNRPEDAFAWIDSTSPEMEERRRNVLVRELRRVQRASFIHFVLLCLIPTVLLIIVIATVVGDEEDCESEATFCELEPRSFMNAFTTVRTCAVLDDMNARGISLTPIMPSHL